MSQIPTYFWPLMQYYSSHESITPSRIEHSRSSTMLPYAIDVDPDRQETSSQLDRLEAKDVARTQPHTPSIWHGFSLRRGPSSKSTSAPSRKQSRKGRMTEWSAFSWILKAHRNIPPAPRHVNSDRYTPAQRSVTTSSSASWATLPSSSPSTTSFNLSYRSHNSSSTSLSAHPSPTDVVVLDPFAFDVLSSQTHDSSETEISTDSQGNTNGQVKVCSDSIPERSPRWYDASITTTSFRDVPEHLHHQFEHGKHHRRRPYGKLLYVPSFDVTLEKNGHCLQKCITEPESGMSYPHFYPPFHAGKSQQELEGTRLSGPISTTPFFGLDRVNANPPTATQKTRPLTILKRKDAISTTDTSTAAMDRSLDVFVVMKALAAVGQQMDKEHDTYLRSSLTREPHDDHSDTPALNDQWCDIVSLDEYLGS